MKGMLWKCAALLAAMLLPAAGAGKKKTDEGKIIVVYVTS